MVLNNLSKIFRVFSCDYWLLRRDLWWARRELVRKEAAIEELLKGWGIAEPRNYEVDPIVTEREGIETIEGFAMRKFVGEKLLRLGRPATKPEMDAFYDHYIDEGIKRIDSGELKL